MPLKFDVKRKLLARSDRVKCVDLHETESWMLASLYNGHVHIWNYDSQQLVKSFEVCDLPVRAAKFVPRKNWIITGSDDMQIRVFNYNTLERIHMFEAHSDYIRSIAIHPAQPLVLTSSDDMLIKLWNWDKGWQCTQVFEGHTHYIMQIVINPKDNNTFASASLDRTVKVWQLGSTSPNFTLEGHEKGVNCVDYYHGGDKPYLISGADDRLVKIWDYQNKTCIQTLEGHTQNISAVTFHPELPVIMTGSEDGTIRIWHANTYRLESTLNYGLERVWTTACLRGTNSVAFGYDEGSIIIKLGREEPAMSMDNSGKIIWARHSELQQANLKAMTDAEIKDGVRLPLQVKDMGSCEIYPQTISHNPNGRFVVVCGDGEYIIYTAMALRNKSFGNAEEFVWASSDSSEYAVRENSTSVKIFKNFKEKKVFKPEYGAEAIFGGFLLGIKSISGLSFHDWETLELIRRIEIQPKHVRYNMHVPHALKKACGGTTKFQYTYFAFVSSEYDEIKDNFRKSGCLFTYGVVSVFWSENGELVCIATDDSFYILKYDMQAAGKAKSSKATIPEDGIEEAFDVHSEVQECVKTGLWIGDCFIYTNAVNRLNYYVGKQVVTISHLDRVMYLLGYIPKDSRLYLGDKELNVVSYSLLLSVLEYQTAIVRDDFETAHKVLPSIPSEQRTRVAHFLEKQGLRSQALCVSTDPDHKFELCMKLGDLDTGYELARKFGSELKWKQLAELALSLCSFKAAADCLEQAKDYGGMLLLATSSGNAEMVEKLAEAAEEGEVYNVAFTSYFLLGKKEKALDILIKTGRVPEAAFFARTYLPSQMSRVTKLWKENLSNVNSKAATALANPDDYENLFPAFLDSTKAEQYLKQNSVQLPASMYPESIANAARNVMEEMNTAEASGKFIYIAENISSTSEQLSSEGQNIEESATESLSAAHKLEDIQQKETKASFSANFELDFEEKSTGSHGVEESQNIASKDDPDLERELELDIVNLSLDQYDPVIDEDLLSDD